MKPRFGKNRIIELAILAVALIVFWIIKVPHLSLPAYWDEAWSYLPAIKEMHQGQLGIWPGVIPTEYSKGHPLLFYFAEALWLRFFGFSLVAAKVLPLLITTGFITASYHFGDKYLGKGVGLMAALLLMAHGMIIAQATLVLPEVMMAFLVLLAVFAYYNRQFIFAALWMLFAVLTKESAVVIAGAIGLHFVIDALVNYKQFRLVTFLKRGLVLFLPIGIYLLFLIWQKSLFGWWFYPDHVARMELNWTSFFARIKEFCYILFRYNNLWCLTIGAIVSVLFNLIQKQMPKFDLRFLVSVIVVVVCFSVFSALNFFSNRYLIVLLPLVLLSLTHILFQCWHHLLFKSALSIVLLFAVVFGSYTERSISDANPWHVQMVRMHRAAIDSMVTEGYQDQMISATFLVEFYSTHPVAGYVSDSVVFNNIKGWYRNGPDLIVASSINTHQKYDSIRNNYPQLLWARWECDVGWVEIYDLGKGEKRECHSSFH